MPRLFFALWPDDEVRAAVAEVANEVRLASGRRVPAANYHVTLAFLGDVDDDITAAALALGETIAGTPFTFTLDRLGWWRGPAVAWFAPGEPPSPLVDLARVLGAALRRVGLPAESGSYRPHLTVARKVAAPPRLDHAFAVHWRVAAMALVASRAGPDGSRYEPVATWRWRD
ncbi:MAG: RNA 2',3'-cyclic phosphodiesterase [Gammaproteobacteria bacterium]|nr:RNA 2',3'-cyclic phosphodiesterase [Gammaproteobacteria bacterium]